MLEAEGSASGFADSATGEDRNGAREGGKRAMTVTAMSVDRGEATPRDAGSFVVAAPA
jgi:hypothetical protein